jgi:F420-0:gamma-glutamyl ligase
LLMKKTSRIPVVIIRGYEYDQGEGSAKELVRAKERDLFR